LNSNVIGSVSQQYAFCRAIGRLIIREMRMRIDRPLDANVGADLDEADVDLEALVDFDLVFVDPFVFVDLAVVLDTFKTVE